MRCGFLKRATWLLALLVPAVYAGVYSVDVNYDGEKDLYYKITQQSQGRMGMGGSSTEIVGCTALPATGISFEADSITNYRITLYTSDSCRTSMGMGGPNQGNKNLSRDVSATELFRNSDSASITVKIDDNRMTITIDRDPESSSSRAMSSSSRGGINPRDPRDPGPANNDNLKFVAFFAPWTNTSAKMFLNGDSILMKPVQEKYCGWYIAAVIKPDSNHFRVYFKQTIGGQYVGAEGVTKTEPMIENEISLDSVAALSDTIWVKGNQEGLPGIYSAHPAGVLGECVKKIPVMMFDWLHGNKSDGDGEGRNGDPANGISADFGSGGCSGSPMKGMVEKQLGPNGVPVKATDFPENCKITDHLDSWFIPESLAVDAQGNTLTNMTCRDLYIALDSTGFWLAEVSKNGIFPDTNNSINKGGMFLLDDFKYLDSAGTILNPYYDQLRGGSDNSNHNFGFTMKFQATFEYVPGQYFDFLGDDDVWVFINNKLVVDIGGQHAQVGGAVDLDTLGLIPDSTYNFHIFYAERHTSSSNFRMRTSIDLKTEASILLQNTGSSADVIEREIYQRVRKSKLSCDFSSNSKETKLERGASTFTLFGGNLPSTGMELDSAGTWFGGIIISDSLDGFKINKEAIKDARGLVPGVYYLRVSLIADNSQHKDVYFVVDAWKVPDLVFIDSTGKNLGSNVWSDTLPLNMSQKNPKDTMWVGQTYKVYVQYADSWAPQDDIVYISTNEEALIPCDSLGNPISEIQLVDGKGSFYVKSVAEILGATLYAKPMSGNSASWTQINFALPPVPQIDMAYMFDRNGDGRGDSIWIKFDGKLGGKNKIDSAYFTFGNDFNKRPYKAFYNDGDSAASIIAEENGTNQNGFGTTPFTGDKEKIYTGQITIWYTYKDNGKRSVYSAMGSLKDKVGPIIEKAEVSYMKDGNTQLTIAFSEALQSKDISSDLFNFHCWNNGVMSSTLTNKSSTASTMSSSQWVLIFPKGADTDIVPAVGDSIKFAPPSALATVLDLEQNRPHQGNPWVRITGEQKVNVTSPGVVTLDPEKNPEAFRQAAEIIRSEDATVPKIIQDPSILTAEQAAAAYGTQGHFLGNLDMAELVENEITAIVNAVREKASYTDEETGATYTIEQIIAMVDGESMSISEAKDRFNLDPLIEEAYEAGILSSQNIDKFQNNPEAIKQIVASVAETTEFDYKATYFSSLGEFVNSNANTITCNSDIFKDNGRGNCLDNNGKMFLAWNMRAKNGRLASTGVYIARLEYRIKVGSKVIVKRTQDFLWGVRRGKVNAIDLGF